MKLTKSIRDEIIDKIIKEKYKEEIKNLSSLFEATVFAEALKQHSAGMELYEKAKILGIEKYFNTRNDINIEDKEGSSVDLSDNYFSISEIIEINPPNSRVRINKGIICPSNSYRVPVLITKQISLAAEKVEKKFKEAEESYSVIKAAVYSANTSKQLIETLPEIERFLPAEQGCVALVPVETINKCKRILKEVSHD